MSQIIKHPEKTMRPNEQHLKSTKGKNLTSSEAMAIAQVGCDLYAQGRLDEARTVFEGLVGLNPNESAEHAALGTVYQKMGRVPDAVTEYTAAIALDPKNPIALANRGELRLQSGDRQGFTDLSQAVDADPHGETVAGRRASSLVKAITLMALKAVRGAKVANSR